VQTTNHYFLQLHVPNPQHGSNHCLSFFKLPYFNSNMLSVHHSYATKAIKQPKTTSFEQQMLCSLFNSLVCWCSTISSCSYFTEQSNSGNHGNKVQLTPAVFSYVPTTLPWSIPFPVQNFRLFLARTIKLASSVYCHTFKILPQIQEGL